MQERRLRSDRLPRHVAVIMDGNGRWAEARGLSRNEGHWAGIEAVRAVVRGAHELGVRTLTLYSFSLENWERPARRGRRADADPRALPRERARRGASQRDPGARHRPPRASRRADPQAPRRRHRAHAATTARCSSCSRSPTAGARRSSTPRGRLLRDAELGKVDPDRLDEKTFAAHLYDPELPDPGSADPHRQRVARLELPALADRVHGDLHHARDVARLPEGSPDRRAPRLPVARAALRTHERAGAGRATRSPLEAARHPRQHGQRRRADAGRRRRPSRSASASRPSRPAATSRSSRSRCGASIPSSCRWETPRARRRCARCCRALARRIVHGAEGLLAVATHDADLVVAALVGAAGLPPTLAAIRAGRDIALANKEVLVMAGALVLREARAAGVHAPARRQRAQRDLPGPRRAAPRGPGAHHPHRVGRAVPHLAGGAHRRQRRSRRRSGTPTGAWARRSRSTPRRS